MPRLDGFLAVSTTKCIGVATPERTAECGAGDRVQALRRARLRPRVTAAPRASAPGSATGWVPKPVDEYKALGEWEGR